MPAVILYAWFLGVALFVGCASAPPEPACDDTGFSGVLPGEAETEIPYGQGVLWRVERPDALPSYVFGTMHSRDPEVTRLAEPVAARFDGARSLAVEVVLTPRAGQIYRRAIEIPDGDLELRIGPERMKLVEEVGRRYGVPEQRLRKLKPWVLALLFSVPPDELLAGRPILDQVLEETAEEREITVYGLESIEEQIRVFDGLDLGHQIALLDAALAENWRIDCSWEAIKHAYLMRDLGTLYALTTRQTDGDDFLWRALIGDRNLRMITAMQDRLAEGNAFIAVGASHLPGQSGILNLLAERGYRVVPVY